MTRASPDAARCEELKNIYKFFIAACRGEKNSMNTLLRGLSAVKAASRAQPTSTLATLGPLVPVSNGTGPLLGVSKQNSVILDPHKNPTASNGGRKTIG
jgi:hypothetical protein